MGLKVLSIKQPWAWLIVHGFKDIENRTWKTEFRGKFLIHAGKKFDERAYEYYRFTYGTPLRCDFPTGALVGWAEIRDVVQKSASPWFQGPNGFVLENARPCNPVPWTGRLGFFSIPDDRVPHLYELPRRSTYR
jgi:hypothetical protein